MTRSLLAAVAALILSILSVAPAEPFKPLEVASLPDSVVISMSRGFSRFPAISPCGTWVAWYSNSDTLTLEGDDNDVDLFARDLITGEMICISVSEDRGPEGVGGDLFQPRGLSVSAGGDFVAFVAFRDEGRSDVMLRDVRARRTFLVSAGLDGGAGNGSSLHPSISRNGRFIAFTSSASNLVEEDNNGFSDIFVHDMETGITERVSRGYPGDEADGQSFLPSISWDGRMVAFTSSATNLVPGEKRQGPAVYVFDKATERTTLVSVSGDGRTASGDSFSLPCSISGDGRNILFLLETTDLSAADSNSTEDLFVRDLPSGATIRASLGNNLTGSGQGAFSGALDFEGRVVVFASSSDHLVKGDVNSGSDIFLRDLQTRRVELISRASDGSPVFTQSSDPVISGNGDIVAFSARTVDLVTGRGSENWQVFIREIRTGKTF